VPSRDSKAPEQLLWSLFALLSIAEKTGYTILRISRLSPVAVSLTRYPSAPAGHLYSQGEFFAIGRMPDSPVSMAVATMHGATVNSCITRPELNQEIAERRHRETQTNQ
jgi:heme exporter protein D